MSKDSRNEEDRLCAVRPKRKKPQPSDIRESVPKDSPRRRKTAPADLRRRDHRDTRPLEPSSRSPRRSRHRRSLVEPSGGQRRNKRLIETLSDEAHDDVLIERRIGDFLLEVSTDSLDVVADKLFALREKSTQSGENLAAMIEKYRAAARKKHNVKQTVSKLSAELLAHVHNRPLESSDCIQELGGSPRRHQKREERREAIAKLRDQAKKHTKDEKLPEVDDAELRREEIKGKLRSTKSKRHQKLDKTKAPGIGRPGSDSQLHRDSGKPDPKHPGEGSPEKESRASPKKCNQGAVSSASKSSDVSSYFKDSCRLEEYNNHLESELTALQQRLTSTKQTNERLEQNMDALCVQLAKDKTLIADLDRNRAELVEERDRLAEKCELFETQMLSLQENVGQLRSQLRSSERGEHEKISSERHESRGNVHTNTDGSKSEVSDLQDENCKIMQNLRTFYDSILIKTRDMFDERLANLDEKLSIPHHRCEHELSELSSGQEEIQEQKNALAEFRGQLDSLIKKAEFYSHDCPMEFHNHNHAAEHSAEDQTEQREEQLGVHEHLRKLLDEALHENERLRIGEATHLSTLQSAEARVAELEEELRGASKRLTENGHLVNILRDDIDADSLVSKNLAVKCRGSGSTSHTDAYREPESGRKSLADHLDVLFSKLLSLQQELQSVRAQRKESAEKLAEWLEHSELLKSELLEKSRQTERLIEGLENAQLESGVVQEAVSKLREAHEEQLKKCKPLLASLTDGLKELVRDGGILLREQSEMVQDLDSQQVRTEFHKMQKKLRKCEETIQSARKNCMVFSDAFDLSLDPNLCLGEFVATMMQSLQSRWVSKEAELKEKDSALATLREEVERTMADLKIQLEIREESLRTLQETISAQAETIVETETERESLEDRVQVLRIGSEKKAAALRRRISILENQLQEAETALSKCSAFMDLRCQELEELLKTTSERKDSIIADLQKALASKSNDFDRMQQELKTLDAMAVMRQRLNSLLDEITSCHRQMDSLTQGIVDRDQKIRDKSRTIQNLTKELNEKAASNDEMQRQLSLKCQEYRELHENLLRTEEKLCSIANQVLAGEAILGHIVDKILPNSRTQDATDSWGSLSEDIVQVVDNLVDAASRTGSLEEELNVLRRMLEKLSPESLLPESQASEALDEVSEYSESSRAPLEKPPQNSEKTRADLARTLENLRIVKSEKTLLQRQTQDERSSQIGEISNLKRLLTETEATLSTFKEENEQLRAFINCGLGSSGTANEASFHLEGFMAKLEGLEKEKAVLRTDLADVQAALERAKIDIQNKTLEIEKLTRAFSKRQSDMTQFEEKLQGLKERFGAKLQALKDELASAQTEKMSLSAKLSALKKHIEETQFEREELICKVQQLESQVLKLENKDLISKSNVKSLSDKFKGENFSQSVHRSSGGSRKRTGNGSEPSEQEKDSVIQELKSNLWTAQKSLWKMTDDLKAKCRERETLRQEIALQNADIKTLNTELIAVRSENSNLNNFIALLRKRFCSANHNENQADSLNLGTQELDESLRVLLEELEISRSQMHTKISGNEDLRKQLQETEAALLLSKDAIDRLEKELALKTEKFEELQERLQASSEDLRRVTLEDDEMKRRLERELNSMKKQLSVCSSSRDSTSTKKSKAPIEIEVAFKRKSKSLKSQLHSAELEIGQLKTSLQTLIKSKKALEQRCQQLAEQCEVKDRVIKRMTDQVGTQEKQLLDEKAEVEKVKTVCYKYRDELSEARKNLETIEKHKNIVEEIQRRLEIRSFDEIIPFLGQQGLAVNELGKGVLKIRSELNGHEGELDELRKTIFQQQSDLSKMLTSIGKKFPPKETVSKRGTVARSKFGAKETKARLKQACAK